MALRALFSTKRHISLIPKSRNFSQAVLSDFAKAVQAEEAHAGKTYLIWRRLSYFVVIPALTWCLYNTYQMEKEHSTHPRQGFEPYEHLRIRKKPFPWGDGNHSLFHNSEVNALPEGYEDM